MARSARPSGAARRDPRELDLLRARLAETERVLAATRRALSARSRVDAATLLPDRAAYDERAELEGQRARRLKAVCGLLVLRVPAGTSAEEWGHIADAVRSTLRRLDFAARTARDTVTVLAPGTVGPGLERLAARLREAIGARVPVEIERDHLGDEPEAIVPVTGETAATAPPRTG